VSTRGDANVAAHHEDAGTLVPDAKAASDAASAGLELLRRRSQHSEETAVLDEEIRVHLEGLGYL
jgi:hypothetical protein